ncbi:tetratricopeptide repeat protein [Streptomyces rhizosphaericus]|uniref:Sel1 repeat family protein n=1 Tax=Streptomyces rhizosphaericus TaxID=114699 RepID=A0ABP4CNE2_9ACTN|nr:sel1 repeat family protein [Streptomyces indonesiensis]
MAFERPDPGLEQAAACGDSRAMMRLARFFEDWNPEQSQRWFHDAAEVGESEAMYRLAELLTKGQADQARHWYRRAAEAGHLEAMYAMSRIGDNLEERGRWLRRAAHSGQVEAKLELGRALRDRACPKRRNDGSAQRPKTTESGGSNHSTWPRPTPASVRATKHALTSSLC